MPVTELSVRTADSRRLAAAVREAGALAMKSFGAAPRSWFKDGDSPVSETDIAVNELLRARLLEGSDDGWLSEESENDPLRLARRRVWVVDPIDGTRAFLAGQPDWTISAALVEDGRPTVAVVYAPASDEFFVAVRGHGASCNGLPISATRDAALEALRCAGPRRYLEPIGENLQGIVIVPRIHSLALRLVRVAQGELDVALAGGDSHDWDLAAADLLVHEAGGLLTSLDGAPLTYNQSNPVHGLLVAAGRARHPAVLALVRAQQYRS
ncbi:MAG TPA: 3'(2'),5'-bisphosphate nucleotidase CysQ [Xanthobacteraceae bacterium]|nr:3'(2'),5'-bisphosphate nucleotidase CysQ [Xanthobacteraceae bacterium]